MGKDEPEDGSGSLTRLIAPVFAAFSLPTIVPRGPDPGRLAFDALALFFKVYPVMDSGWLWLPLIVLLVAGVGPAT